LTGSPVLASPPLLPLLLPPLTSPVLVPPLLVASLASPAPVVSPLLVVRPSLTPVVGTPLVPASPVPVASVVGAGPLPVLAALVVSPALALAEPPPESPHPLTKPTTTTHAATRCMTNLHERTAAS